ncbi:hypothetical protein SSX86_002052 [Deinandra increscens subsp. villosa]|uniref:Uncharacterized protein n=1 Tax=Deinandra increscens subsp. villosa TaxID=3103831 RepID=A0AAP0DMU5_9ASTR
MAQHTRQQLRLHELPPMASYRHQRFHHGRLTRRNRRGVLPEHVPHVPLPLSYVRHIAVLIGLIIFAYAVTDKGSGRPVLNRVHPDYYLQDYAGWLKDRVASDGYWVKIRSR